MKILLHDEKLLTSIFIPPFRINKYGDIVGKYYQPVNEWIDKENDSLSECVDKLNKLYEYA